MIVTSGKTLLELVNDILDLSKLDAGKLELNPVPTDLGAVVRELLPVFQPRLEQKQQKLVVDIAELPLLLADAHRLRQILFNFVGNAVKYAGPCTIRVSVGYAKGLLRLSVADNGKGVSAALAERLMTPFEQVDPKNRSEGTGLGLPICKRLVEIAKGRIWIETALGKGFAIHVEIPVEEAKVGERGTGVGERGTGVGERADGVPAVQMLNRPTVQLPNRILAVDDSPVNRSVLKAMLTKIGVNDLVLAEDGKMALERLRDGLAVDVVLTDMWMPEMDGEELVKAIRSDSTLKDLKVVAVTADVEAMKTYQAQGFDEILVKPVTMEKLRELFTRLGAQ